MDLEHLIREFPLMGKRRRPPTPRKKRWPDLEIEQILAWADAHHARTGRWPTAEAGPIADAPGETWNALDKALKKGGRGLPGGSSLACLLEERRDVPHRLHLPRLSIEQILRWAD